MKQTRISTVLLMITTFIWGLSFLVVQDSFASGWQPFAIIFVRSLLGALLCFAFSFKQTWWKHRQLWLDSMLCGVVYFMGFAFQSFGQLYSTIPNTAFITTLNVLFVPLILWVFVRKRPQRKVLFAVLFALAGTAILSFQHTLQINKGDLYLILCAIGFALQIIFAQRAAKHQLPFAAAGIQLLTMGILSGLGMLITKQTTLPSQGWGGMLYIGLLATGLCGIFQMIAQRHVSESTTSIIYSFESAIASIAAVALGYQLYSWHILVGGLCMFFSVLLVEVNWKKKRTAKMS